MHERDANFTEPIPARLRPNRLRIVSLAKIAMDKFARLRRVIIAVMGFTVLLIGVALVVLPGPAIVVIPWGSLFWQLNSFGPGGCYKEPEPRSGRKKVRQRRNHRIG